MDYNEMLVKAQRLCAKSEKCAFDIRKKLQQWEASEQDTENAIDNLQTSGFIDHKRYARAFTRDKLKFNHWGRKKIEHALRLKNIEPKYIKEAIDAISEETYMTILKEEIEKKDKTFKNTDYLQRKNKICNYLLQKGFESGKVFELIENKLKK